MQPTTHRRVLAVAAVALALTAVAALVGTAPPEAGAASPPITAPPVTTPSAAQFAPTVSCGTGPSASVLQARAARAGHPIAQHAAATTADCASVIANGGPTRNLGVTYGWYIYIHFTPRDVDAILWDHAIGAGWAAIMTIVCGAVTLADAPAGVACLALESYYLWWVPAIFQTAHARNSGGVVFECLLPPVDLPVGYYYSGNGQ